MKKLHRWDFFMQYKSFGVILLTVLYVALPGWSAAETKAPTPQAAKLAPVPPQPEKILQQACDFFKSVKEFSFKADAPNPRAVSWRINTRVNKNVQ